MGPYKRNWFVGGTVLLGLITLGLLIILFGGSLGSVFAGEKIPVTFRSDRADGLNPGASIRYLGQQVGVVQGVELKLDTFPNYVLIHCELDKDRPLPADARGVIAIPNFLGAGSIIELVANNPEQSTARLVGGETLEAEYLGLSVLPPEFADLASEMKGAVAEFRKADVITSVKRAVDNFNGQLAKAGQVMEDMHAVLGDQAVQTDLKTAVANFRQAVDNANAVTANVKAMTERLAGAPDKVNNILAEAQGAAADARGAIKTTQERIVSTSDQINRNLERLAVVLDETRQISEKINKGPGTAALLLNDPKLYNKLVAGTEAIEATVLDIQRVVKGFEQDGVPIDIK